MKERTWLKESLEATNERSLAGGQLKDPRRRQSSDPLDFQSSELAATKKAET